MTADDVQARGRRAGQDARHSSTLQYGARAGLVAYGVVHLLIAWLALQVAWTHDSASTDQAGALNTVAREPLGSILLWVAGLGLFALVAWQLAEAALGHTDEDGAKRVLSRLSSAGRAAVYAALAWSAIATAAGSSGGSSEEGVTTRIMALPGGQVLVVLVAVVILVVAGALAYQAISKDFTEHLEPGATHGDHGTAVVRLGQVGYAAKALVIAAVGLLFGWAAITFDPQHAGSIDDVLSQLLDQPYGKYLVTIAAVGLAAFGVYCLAWARWFRR